MLIVLLIVLVFALMVAPTIQAVQQRVMALGAQNVWRSLGLTEAEPTPPQPNWQKLILIRWVQHPFIQGARLPRQRRRCGALN